ncbi:MAG: hypothetical protein EHM72_03700 [Calditrichaeota bacterium]|nr:MAG: hypothetical protein EHM72_03700 [Calditrichota bacterium]
MSPWSMIWLNPRLVIRQVLLENPHYSMKRLIIGGGIGQAFSYAVSFGLGQVYSTAEVIAIVLLLGPISAFISLALWAWLLSLICRWFGGKASRQELRVAVAWSWAPIVYLLPMWGVRYILFRDELFLPHHPFVEAHAILNGIYSFFNGIDFLISFVSLFILFQTIAEVNSFTVWRSLGSVAVMMLLLMLPVLFLVKYVLPI